MRSSDCSTWLRVSDCSTFEGSILHRLTGERAIRLHRSSPLSVPLYRKREGEPPKRFAFPSRFSLPRVTWAAVWGAEIYGPATCPPEYHGCDWHGWS